MVEILERHHTRWHTQAMLDAEGVGRIVAGVELDEIRERRERFGVVGRSTREAKVGSSKRRATSAVDCNLDGHCVRMSLQLHVLSPASFIHSSTGSMIKPPSAQ